MRSLRSMMGRPAKLLGACIAVAYSALLTSPVLAQAEPPATPSEALPEGRLELDWRSPAACDERARTLATVNRLLGASPRERAEAPLVAEASVTRTATGEWHLLLLVAHGAERLTRQLGAASCAELSDAAALILALVLDPELLSRGSEAVSQAGLSRPAEPVSSAPQPAAAALPAPAPPMKPSAAPEPGRERTRLAPFIQLGPVLGLGVIPSPAFGVSLSGGFDAAAWRFGLTFAFFPRRRETVPEPPGASATFELRALSLAGCWAPEISRQLRLGPCLVTDFGSITAQGEGVEFAEGDSQLWGATGVAGMLSYFTRSAFELGAQASLLVPWGRTEFQLAGDTIYQPAALSLGLRGYLGVRF